MAVGSVGNSVINLTPGALTGVDAGASSSIESDVSDQLKNFQTLKDPAATGPEVAAVQGLLHKQIATLSASSNPDDQKTALAMQHAMPANGAAASSYKDIQGAVKAFQDGEGLTKPGQPADGVVGQQTFAGLLGVKDDAKFGFGGTGATKTSPDIAATSAAAFDKIAGAKAKLTPTAGTGTSGESSFVAGGANNPTTLTTPSSPSATPVPVSNSLLANQSFASLQAEYAKSKAAGDGLLASAMTAAKSAPPMSPEEYQATLNKIGHNQGASVSMLDVGRAQNFATDPATLGTASAIRNAMTSAGGTATSTSSSSASSASSSSGGGQVPREAVQKGLQHISNMMGQLTGSSYGGQDKLQVMTPNPTPYQKPYQSISEFGVGSATAPDEITVRTSSGHSYGSGSFGGTAGRDAETYGGTVTLSADVLGRASVDDNLAQQVARQLIGQ